MGRIATVCVMADSKAKQRDCRTRAALTGTSDGASMGWIATLSSKLQVREMWEDDEDVLWYLLLFVLLKE